MRDFIEVDISYHRGNPVRNIEQKGYFIKDGRISGYFDTKYVTVVQIEQILHNFNDQKIANIFNLEQVNFRVTLICGGWITEFINKQINKDS